MRSILTTIGVAALLALPVAATGSSESSTSVSGLSAKAAAQRGEQINFRLVFEGNTPIKVKRFRFEGLQTTCDGGVDVEIDGFKRFMRVNDNRVFRGVDRKPDGKVKIAGEVFHARVEGKLRAEGNFGPGQNCDSGIVRWVAR